MSEMPNREIGGDYGESVCNLVAGEKQRIVFLAPSEYFPIYETLPESNTPTIS